MTMNVLLSVRVGDDDNDDGGNCRREIIIIKKQEKRNHVLSLSESDRSVNAIFLLLLNF